MSKKKPIHESKIFIDVNGNKPMTQSIKYLIVKLEQSGYKLLSADIARLSLFNVNDIDDGLDGLSLYDRFFLAKSFGKNSSSIESHIARYGADLGKSKFEAKNVATAWSSKEKFKFRHGDDWKIYYDDFQMRRGFSIGGFIHRHGDIDGPRLYREFWDNTNFSTRENAFIRRHGEEEGKRRYLELCENTSLYASGESWDDKDAYSKMITDRSESIRSNPYERDNVSLNAFIRRHGEEDGKRRYDLHCAKMRATSPYMMVYWLNKGYDVDSAIQAVAENRARRNGDGKYHASKSSLRVFISLYRFCRRNGIDRNDIYFGVNGSKERWIGGEDTLYFYDFCILNTKIQCIIEYNGKSYHFSQADIDDVRDGKRKLPFICDTICDMELRLEHDSLKTKAALDAGYDILVIWEDEIDKLEKCKDFIREQLIKNSFDKKNGKTKNN